MQSVDIFANFSVGKKLLFGFAMVLLLTLGVAGTGFYAVDSILTRAAQMNQLSRINAAILDARGQERDYALTRQAASAEALRGTLDRLKQELIELEALSTSAEQAQLRQIRSDAELYATQFNEYGFLIDRGAQLREHMDEAAQSSREEFEFIELSMYDAVRLLRIEGERLQGSDPLTVAEATSGLTKRILDLRTFESMFIGNSSQAAVDSWNEAYAEVKSIGDGLQRWLNEEQQATMNGALTAIGNYEKAFTEFRGNRGTRIALEQAMQNQAQRILDAADQALAQATGAMQTQRSNVFLMLTVITALAALIGMAAAMLITRMIVVPLRYTVQLAQQVAGGDLTQTPPG